MDFIFLFISLSKHGEKVIQSIMERNIVYITDSMIGYKFVEFAPTRFWGFLQIDAINDKKSVMTNQKKRNMFIVPKNSLVSHQKEFFGILYLGSKKIP